MACASTILSQIYSEELYIVVCITNWIVSNVINKGGFVSYTLCMLLANSKHDVEKKIAGGDLMRCGLRPGSE